MNRIIALLWVCATLFSSLTTPASANERPSPDNVRRFVTVMAEIKHNYIKPVDDNTLFSNAMKGMVARLDPHSAYLDAADLKQLRSATSGRFAGIGIEMIPANGVIKVISPLDGSPAAKANIRPGDYIIRINNHMVDGMSLQEIVKKIRGPKGSKVKLTIMRQGQTPFQVTLTREIIKIRNIKAKLYDKKIAYVRIAQFQDNTKKQLISALRRLQNKHHQSIQALIIDLRNNPGGLLHSAVDISDAFLDSRTLGSNQLIVREGP